MFNHLAHNVFDGIKLEPLNYYSNEHEAEVATPYESHLTPQVDLQYDGSQTIKKDDCESNHSPLLLRKDKKTKSQTCKICNKTLASPSSYYVHMKQHSSAKPFSCTRCDATFCRKPYLEVHMRVHTGERPYECSICQKRFTQKSSLNTHKRAHSGLRPYVCPVCYKGFSVKSYLTAHRWTHVTETAVSCAECAVAFNDKQAYAQHVRNNHRRQFECKKCNKGFVKESYLIRHRNRIHQQGNDG